MRNVRIDTAASRQRLVAVQRSLAEEAFSPYEAALMLDSAGSDPHEREAAVERIVTAVANGCWIRRESEP